MGKNLKGIFLIENVLIMDNLVNNKDVFVYGLLGEEFYDNCEVF